jgi:hypothetical protein
MAFPTRPKEPGLDWLSDLTSLKPSSQAPTFFLGSRLGWNEPRSCFLTSPQVIIFEKYCCTTFETFVVVIIFEKYCCATFETFVQGTSASWALLVIHVLCFSDFIGPPGVSNV